MKRSPRRQINDLWEAVHPIPELLTRWDPDAEGRLLMYLEEYNERWASPSLLNRYADIRDRSEPLQ